MIEVSRGCPKAEILASFVEGKLPADVRSELVRHLDRCPLCREVTAETVALQSELRAARPARGRYAAAAAVAAILILAAWFGILGPWRDDGSDPGAREYLARAGRLGQETRSLLPAGPGRGGYAFGSELGADRAAFRIGVRLVTLEVAGAAAAPRAATETAQLLTLFEGTADLATRYRELGVRPETGVAGLADVVVDLLEAQGRKTPLALGAWAQFARLAIRSGDQAFDLADDPRLLRERLTDSVFPAGVGRTLQEIESIGAAGRREQRRLERLLDDLIDMM